MNIKRSYIIILLFWLPLTLCSWSLKYPDSISVVQNLKESKAAHKNVRKISKAPKSVNFDYGDRTQLSAFLLWLFFGYAGAHWFYMQYYALGALQLSITLSVILLFVFLSVSLFTRPFVFWRRLVLQGKKMVCAFFSQEQTKHEKNRKE